MNSKFDKPINIGSEEMISINNMVEMVSSFEGKKLKIEHVKGPQGVRGRNSNNRLIEQILNHSYNYDLERGLKETYFWVLKQLTQQKKSSNSNNEF
jgi:GDP-D-mannose 3',5'-epimerase